MTDFVHVEPAPAHRQGFARWCLSQDPKIQTASQSGSDVPRDRFGDIPLDLLDGARVDGHVFRPVLDGFAPDGDGYKADAPAAAVPVQDGAQPEKVPADAAKPRTRRAGTRKGSS